MQQKMGNTEEEVARTDERLSVAETERDQAMDFPKEAKRVADKADTNLIEATSARNSRNVADVDTQMAKMKAALEAAYQELTIKETEIESLKAALEEVKSCEGSVCRSEDEMSSATSYEAESKRRMEELEIELEREKESEKKMLDCLAQQTKQLEQTKILLEESKIEVVSLREKLEKLDNQRLNGHLCIEGCNKEGVASVKLELESTKENLIHAQETAKFSSAKAESLLEEMSVLKKELDSATEAEVTSKKAMDDLALALKEVAMDCSQVKEKLVITEVEVEAARFDANESKEKLESVEEKYKTLLQEARKEAELHKNTADRLRLEAEESLMAWNGKEGVFVNCIKKSENEKNSLIDENNRLLQALITAENLSKKAKEENSKLRDILKQAINEANVVREAVGIARGENAHLKDALREKEEAINFLSRENEHLKINNAAAQENINELKRLLIEASTAIESRMNDKEYEKGLSHENSMEKENLSHQNSMDKEQQIDKKEQQSDKEQHNDKKEPQKDKKESDKVQKDKKENGKKEKKEIDKKEQQNDKEQHNDKKEPQKDKKESDKERHHDKKEIPKDKKENGKKEKKESEKKEHLKDKKEQQKEKKENEKIDRPNEKKDHQSDKKEQQREKKPGKSYSFSLKMPLKHSKDTAEEETKTANQQHDTEDSEESPGSDTDPLKGSIFDVVDSPEFEKPRHHRKKSSFSFSEDVGDTISSEDLEHLEGNHLDEGETEKGTRKKKAFIRRFGSLLVRRTSFHKKEPSIEEKQHKKEPSIEEKQHKKEPSIEEKQQQQHHLPPPSPQPQQQQQQQ